MKSTTFKHAQTFLQNELKKSKEIIIPTLGRGKYITVNHVDGNFIHFVFGNKKTIAKINQDLWDAVMNRLSEIPEAWHEISSAFNTTNTSYRWAECPQPRLCPYIPAIVRYLNELKTG